MLTSSLKRELKLTLAFRDASIDEMSHLLERAAEVLDPDDFSAKALILRRKLSYAVDHLRSHLRQFSFVRELTLKKWQKNLDALLAHRAKETAKDPLRVRAANVVRMLQNDHPELASLGLTLVDAQLFTACWALLRFPDDLSQAEQERLVAVIVTELKKIGSGYSYPDDWSSATFGLVTLLGRRDFPHGTLLRIVANVFSVDGLRSVWHTAVERRAFYDIQFTAPDSPRFISEIGRHRTAAERNGDLASDFRSCVFLIQAGLQISAWLSRTAQDEKWRGLRNEVRNWTHGGILYVNRTLFGKAVKAGHDILPSKVMDIDISSAKLAPIARLIYLNVLSLILYAALDDYRYKTIETAVKPLAEPNVLKINGGSLGPIVGGDKYQGDIVQLVEGLQQVVDSISTASEDEKREIRPFVVLIASLPGSGKSFLVENLLFNAVNRDSLAEKKSINVANHQTKAGFVDELSGSLQEGGSTKSFVYLFIDEVDSKVEGDHVYRWLLPFLWDRKCTVPKVEHFKPSIIFLAVSDASSSREYLSRLRDPRNGIEKGPDLASRIDDWLDIPPLSAIERRQLLDIMARRLGYSGASVDFSALAGIAQLDDNSRGIVSLLKGVGECGSPRRKLQLSDLRARAKERLLGSACIDNAVASDLDAI